MRTILIIDDDIAIGNMEQEVLERVGYTTRSAYSGTESLLIHLLLQMWVKRYLLTSVIQQW